MMVQPGQSDDSNVTAAQANATEFTPDFSIVKAHVVMRPTSTVTIDHLPFSSWNNIAIKAFIVPFIAELKRPPTRRSPSLEFFQHELDTMFDQAYQDLEDQVKNAFLMQPKVDRIILFAAVGEWWSWTFATRDHYISQSSDSCSTDEADEASSTSESRHSDSSYDPSPLFQPAEPPRQQPSRPAKNNRKYTTSPIPSLRASDTRSYNPRRKGEEKKKKLEHSMRYTDLGTNMEQVRNDVNLAKPRDNLWSKIILLGSPASNQRLFLIHRFLSIECKTMLDATLLENTDEDNSDEDNSEEDGIQEDDAAYNQEGPKASVPSKFEYAPLSCVHRSQASGRHSFC